MARDGRVVQLIDGGPEAVAAVAIGGASAGYRVVVARLADPDAGTASVIELVPPGAIVPPGPRTRGNVALPAVPGGAGDPDLVPGPGLFAPPERFDQRPFSATEAARAVTEAAVETLRARGEPARFERLFGEILVGLDRSGQLRRLAAGSAPATTLDDPRRDRSPRRRRRRWRRGSDRRAIGAGRVGGRGRRVGEWSGGDHGAGRIAIQAGTGDREAPPTPSSACSP